MKKMPNKISIRSSTAEYLTFISATGDNQGSIELRYEDENIWMTQKMMAELYGVSVQAIDQHIKTLIKAGELNEATIKQYLIVQNEGKRVVQRKVDHYNLQAIISVGFKIENEHAVQFRKWAREIVKEYTIKGFAMDDERLKSGGSILTKQFFAMLQNKLHWAIHGQTASEMIISRASAKKENMGLTTWKDAPK